MNNLHWWIIEQKTHYEQKKIFESNIRKRPWVRHFLIDPPLSPGNLNSVCRIGYVPFDQCLTDRYFYIDRSKKPEILAGGGITTQIYWDFNNKSLPAGWQGAVRQSFTDQISMKRKPNTQVALLAFTTKRFRGKGLSGKILIKMCKLAKKRNYRYLIVPSLPPLQFKKEYAQASIQDISRLKRSDGEYEDYWIRVHKKNGAKIIGCTTDSHRFIFNLNDFKRYVSSDPINTTGDHLVRLDKDTMLGPKRNDMWQIVYADLERSFVVFNWGCVWVSYDLQKIKY
ncbi:hypothetical protein ACFL5W_01730 [Thermodesulfobacteriota bacterium]